MHLHTLSFRASLVAVLLAWGGSAAALGLGEIRTSSALGESLSAEVEILAGGREALDASCFRLRSPQSETDLPWLRRASLVLKKGPPQRLEIRSDAPLKDPILQIGLAVGCGHEVQRDYTLLLQPRDLGEQYRPMPPQAAPAEAPPAARRRVPLAAESELPPPPRPPAQRKPVRRPPPVPLPDRLVLSAPGEGGGEPSLRMATELFAWKGEDGHDRERQREILRVEYQLLAAMHEQATSQLAAAEKLRSMEAALGQLQRQATDFAGRIEKEGAPQPPAGTAATPAAPAPAAADEGLSEWSFYAALLAASLGVAGWLGWRQYRERRANAILAESLDEEIIEPTVGGDFADSAGLDLPAEPDAGNAPTQIDAPLDEGGATEPASDVEQEFQPGFRHSLPGATVDEHFEANPVMELAEIMLSFGRVKGAAQALQEFVDHNPQEALKPWIRLMEVYRMAGMREEFERVSRELNRNFNVEIQQWSPEQTPVALDKAIDLVFEAEAAAPTRPAEPKAGSLEDMAHIRNRLIETWGEPQSALDYLNLLLRDNRGGKRLGFPLPVVEEILLLVDVVETKISMEKQAA